MTAETADNNGQSRTIKDKTSKKAAINPLNH